MSPWFLDANHCPGSIMLHLRHSKTGHTVLHTGDFRGAECVQEDPLLHELIASHGPIGVGQCRLTLSNPR